MWDELGKTSVARFFGIDEKKFPTPRPRGEAFIACSHLPSIDESYEATRKLAVQTATALDIPGYVLLLSAYGPVVSQGLPDILAVWFALRSRNHRWRYYYPASEYTHCDEGFVESWFTFEGSAETLDAILEEKRRIGWGSGIVLGGVQVPEDKVEEAIKASPFKASTIRSLAPSVRVAFRLNNDMNELAVFLSGNPPGDVAGRLGINARS